MTILKWFGIFCFSLIIIIFPDETYGSNISSKENEAEVELNDKATIKELEYISGNEVSSLISGRKPLSVDVEGANSLEGKAVVGFPRNENKIFRAPAINNPKVLTTNQ